MHEDNCAVYVHVNLINGKKYFGITTWEPERRWGKDGARYYRNDHFTNAINKYGWDNFGHFVLYKNIPIKIAKNIEELLIKEHMSYDPRFGYNKTMGGELEIPTEETREKLSQNNSMKRPEYRRKVSVALKKHYEDHPEARAARSEMHKDYYNKHPEAREKISNAKKELYKNHPEANPMYGKFGADNPSSKPVEAINPETGQIVYRFDSTASAGRAGFSPGAISNCCNGKAKTSRGLYWRYVEEVNDDDSDN